MPDAPVPPPHDPSGGLDFAPPSGPEEGGVFDSGVWGSGVWGSGVWRSGEWFRAAGRGGAADGPGPARERRTLLAAGAAAAVAAVLLGWNGWRWWDARHDAAQSAPLHAPARLGVSFAPVPVRGAVPKNGASADGGAAGPPGLLVTGLSGDGAARRSGVRVGDVWLTLGGQPLCLSESRRDAAGRVRLFRALLADGFAADAELLRDGEPVRLRVSAAAPSRPPAPPPRPVPPLTPARGVIGAELLTTAPDYPDGPPGVTVSWVLPGGPADAAGVRVGDRLVGLTRGPDAAGWLPDLLALLGEAPADGSTELALTESGSTDWAAVVGRVRPGERVTADLRRHGRPVRVRVRFAARADLPSVRRPPALFL